LRAAGQSLTEYRRQVLHGVLLSLAVLAIVTAVAGGAVTSSASLLASKPVAETSAGYLRPPVLLSGAANFAKDVTVHDTATGSQVAVAAAQQTPEPQATPDPTAVPEPAYFTYSIQAGDTVDSIAAAYGIDPGYIIWNNPEISDPDSLIVGATMVIPSTDGLVYNVTLGDTIGGIASTYGVDVSSIVGYAPNGLTSADNIVEGKVLLVPGAAIPAPAPEPDVAIPAAVPEEDTSAPAASSGFIWPWYGGISQYFGEPELGSYHKGLDIEGYTGGTIVAAAAGRVVLVAWDDYGLGYHVIIDHGDGFQTIYAHLSDIWVSQGQYVDQGEAVGALGSTGYSTGPHLHFQINYYGTPVDPLGYLP
jgi:murein DD-endopeptidase MepM/ murein hydrolase activator NlpD